MPTTSLALVAAGLLLTGACTGSGSDGAAEKVSAEVTSLTALDSSLSMTESGRALLEQSDFAKGAPRVHVTASVDPATGKVKGTMRGRLPVGAGVDQVRLRYFAGLESFKAAPEQGPVKVDSKTVEATREAGLITVPLADGHPDTVEVEMPFSYTLRETESGGAGDLLGALGGENLSPAEIGLLARHPDEVNLGHWYPTWIPDGRRDDAEPRGFGDIGNFAAADLSVTLTVPDDWTVIDTGIRVDEGTEDGKTTITSYGTGMREIAVVVAKGYESESREVGEVTLLAHAPAEDKDQLDGVLDESEASLKALSEALGGYPWKELDVVSAPLGAGVSGMEWPGGTWIEPSVFKGQLPGLGALGDLGELGELGGMGDLLGGALSGLGLMAQTVRPWTIAHEIGHMWWTIQVGNDSIAAPVVDEPLAQYSACLVMRTIRDTDAAQVCRQQIVAGYDGLRLLGDEDAKADQATDQFDSSTQYGGVIYGKAPMFYLALEKEYGAGRVRDVLRAVVREHAFETIDGAQLRASLVAGLDQKAGALWDRWMEEVHGAEDMPQSDAPTGSGELGDLLGNLDGMDAKRLQELLEKLLSEIGSPDLEDSQDT